MAMDLRKFRVDDDLWVAAGARAAAEGTNVSALIRQWLEDYVSGGQGNANRVKVRLSAAERDAVTAALGGIAETVVDAINGLR